MIKEIPTPDEYYRAGFDSLYLAWQIAMRAIVEFTELQQILMNEGGSEIDRTVFYRKSQPALGNAYGLVQQAAEFAIKGHIAAVSPFLLIAHDPKDWPKRVSSEDVPFSEFRTLDASDLVKAHNAVVANKLDDEFQHFWHKLRRDRNKIIHSVTAETVDPSTLLISILNVNETLFVGECWPARLLRMQSEGAWAEYGYFSDYTLNNVMYEIEQAINQLKPAECKKYFGFDKKRRLHMCPDCLDSANSDLGDKIPKLAQLLTKNQTETNLLCVVCEVVNVVERSRCKGPYCDANVLQNGRCLCCGWKQDSPAHFQSGLAVEESEIGQSYCFNFLRMNEDWSDTLRFSDDFAAIEHAKLTLSAEHLTSWVAVVVERDIWLGFHAISGHDTVERVVGSWVREGTELKWRPDVKVGKLQ